VATNADLANLGSQARQCSFRLLKSLADNPTLAMNSSASASVLKALNVSSLTLRGGGLGDSEVKDEMVSLYHYDFASDLWEP